MNRSIHRFLTVNALSVVGLAILLAIIAVFFLKQDSIKLHLDAELSLEAHSLESFITQRIPSKQLSYIQEKINNIPIEASSAIGSENHESHMLKKLLDNTQFQVWDLRTEELILQSPNAPSIPLHHKIGYDKVISEIKSNSIITSFFEIQYKRAI